ncbi:TIGR03936 family radical SAM-associated protein [Dethiothermospora halolimnae]|uniref:TIGR03936 family radical SAM-associated protein n=1 Tax=Dethiothermospora halolimnae TaxID=3114390 RepID=UPI003CCC0194
MIKIRGKFIKGEELKYIGHLDLMRLFQRAFRRANIPMKYSEGYNPQPKFSTATALALGIPSDGEYFEIELVEKIDIDGFVKNMNRVLPNGIEILKAVYVDSKKSLTSKLRWATYIMELTFENSLDKDGLESEIDKLLKKSEIIITKEKKKKGKIKIREVNIRDYIEEILVLLVDGNNGILKTKLKTGSQGNLKPEVLIESMEKYCNININGDKTKIKRLELFIEENNKIITPL